MANVTQPFSHYVGCTSTSCVCDNYAKNLVDLFYRYWLGKITLENTEADENRLEDIFTVLDFKVMQHGIIPVLLNYGFGITISQPVTVRYDKNYQPIIADVMIKQLNGSTITVKAYDHRLKRNKGYFTTFMIVNGLMDEKTEQLNANVYECIFFQNNFSFSPSLDNLSKIIMNVHALDEKADKNREIYNIFYTGESSKKFTREQLTNFGVVLSSDGYGAIVTTFADAAGNLLDVKKQPVTQSLSRWPDIKDELDFWLDRFYDFAGISKEKLSAQRENVGETSFRVARVSILEKEHYKYRERFIKQYNEYFNTDIQLVFDTVVNNFTDSNMSGEMNVALRDDEKNNAGTETKVMEGVDANNDKN